MKPEIIAMLVLLWPDLALSLEEAPPKLVKITPPATVTAKAESAAKVAESLQVNEGYHVNSNTPAEDYITPLKLIWSPGPLQSGPVTFLKPQFERFQFSEKLMSVFKGAFDVATRFKVPADAKPGSRTITGKLHYQACNDRMCITAEDAGSFGSG
jgi:hypothetical protein